MIQVEGKEVDFVMQEKFEPSLLIETMFSMLEMIDSLGSQMNRISMHAINFHMLCFEREIWKSGSISVAKAIQASLQMAGGYSKNNFTSIKEDLIKLRFNIPKKLSFDTKIGRIEKTKEELIEKPVFSFRYGKFSTKKIQNGNVQ